MKKMILFGLGIIFLCSIVTASRIQPNSIDVGNINHYNYGYGTNILGSLYNDTINGYQATSTLSYDGSSYYLNYEFYDYLASVFDFQQYTQFDNNKITQAVKWNGKSVFGSTYTGTTSDWTLYAPNSFNFFEIYADDNAPYVYTNLPLQLVNYTGSGNGFACFDSSGTLYRSDTACA